MNTKTPILYELLDSKEKGHEFVNGNTKYLNAMNQKDLEVLFKNGDARVKEKVDNTKVVSIDVKKDAKA